MSIADSETMAVLCAVTVNLPIGTNLALLHFLWMQLSGVLLPSRGALFPGLQAIGLAPAAVRRAWAAFRYGAWETDELLLAWEQYVLEQGQVQPDNPTFTVAAIYDPRYQEPWLLACPLQLSGPALRGLYRDRWPVEQVPLAGKQMLGGARQFVFAPESCQRLPELNLFVGAMVTYLAATLPAVPTGFWDRNPKLTPGRLGRLLARTPFPESYPLPARLRKKDSVFDHLPKGILGHRRTKQAANA